MKKKSDTGTRATTTPRARQLQVVVDLLIDTHTAVLELVVSAGLQVLDALLEEDRRTLCGARYAHDAGRRATRAGRVASAVVLGGRKVAIRRPRVRGAAGEVTLPTWHALADQDPLTRRAVEQMVLGGTGDFGGGVELVGRMFRLINEPLLFLAAIRIFLKAIARIRPTTANYPRKISNS